MTPRSLFIIILKVLGLFLLKDLIFLIPTMFSSSSVGMPGNSFRTEEIALNMVEVLLCAVLFFFTYCLIFRPGWIIDKLKLDKGFEQETFSFIVNQSAIINMAILIIGIYLLIDTIPLIILQIISYIQMHKVMEMAGHSNIGAIIMKSVKIIVAYFLLSNSNYITNFITSRKKTEG